MIGTRALSRTSIRLAQLVWRSADNATGRVRTARGAGNGGTPDDFLDVPIGVRDAETGEH